MSLPYDIRWCVRARVRLAILRTIFIVTIGASRIVAAASAPYPSYGMLCKNDGKLFYQRSHTRTLYMCVCV